VFWMTFVVMAPEHPLVDKITTNEYKSAVEAYKEQAKFKTQLERTELQKEKTGQFTWAYAINPFNGDKIPVYIWDYVLANYGTWVVMAVPAHDERDYAFAKEHNIEIIQVLAGGDISKEAYTADGVHINSGFLDGLNKEDAINKMCEWLEEHHCGKKAITYRLREWIFARQRYWGEPVPMATLDDGSLVMIETLPVVLPELDDYKGHNGLAPLANAKEWKNITVDGKHATREINTMPGSAGSSWYFLRYIDPHTDKVFADYELLKHWMPVDLYIGGPEHAVGHLLYSRFWNNFLFDKGFVPVQEPFKKLCHQGMILGENGEKMSKSRGNVINPNDIVKEYGADTLRLYEMFMGPLQDAKPWNTKNIEGPRKFLDRIWRLYINDNRISDEDNKALETLYHQTVKKVTNDYESLNFNTAISQMMVFVNAVYKEEKFPRYMAKGLLQLLNPICPFVTEEINEKVFPSDSILALSNWPKYDEEKTTNQTYTLVVQVNGKLRDKIDVDTNCSNEEIQNIALSSEKVRAYTDGHEIVKVVVVPKKLVSVVIK